MPLGRSLVAIAMLAACSDSPRPPPREAPPPARQVASTKAAPVAADVVAHASDDAPSPTTPLPPPVSDELGVAQLVARHRARLIAEREAPVHVIAERDAFEAARQLCERVVPQRPPETPVLIKPNSSGIDRMRDGIDDGVELRTVGYDFLRGVIACLTARGHREITITDTWTRPEQRERWMRVTGIDRLVREEGVRFVGLFDDRGPDGTLSPTIAAPLGADHTLGDELRVPRVVARHLRDGLFISVPKMKMHRFAVMTLSIKNNMGLVVIGDGEGGETRAGRMHREIGAWLERFRGPERFDDREAYVASLEIFSRRIVDVLEVITPDAVLIDGVPPVAGDGFALNEPFDAGVAIGSTNPVLADAVALEWMGMLDNPDLEREIHHRTSPLVEEAARRFYGDTAPLQAIRVEGDTSFRTSAHVAHYRGFPGFEVGHPPSPAPELPWLARAVHATRTEQAPAVDGVLDDAAWATARPVSIDHDWRGRAAPAGLDTDVRFVFADDALCMGFEAAYQTLVVDDAAPIETEHPALYRFDAVEAFIDPTPRTPETYIELELGPRGHFMDIDVDRNRQPRGDVAWSSGMRVATRVDAAVRRYVIEACVPASAFGVERLGAADWRIGLYRVAGEGRQRPHLARYPTYTERPSFHVPERFGWLRLE